MHNSGKYEVTRAMGSKRKRMIMQEKLHARKRTGAHDSLVSGNRKLNLSVSAQNAKMGQTVPSEESSSGGGTGESDDSDSSDSNFEVKKRKASTAATQFRKRIKLSKDIDSESGSESETTASDDSDEIDSSKMVATDLNKKTKLVVGQKTGHHDDVPSSDDGDSESNENTDEGEKPVNDEFDAIRKEIADMPFDELQKLRDKVGLKAYNQALYGKGSGHGTGKRIFKRANKNRPMEMSSKAPVQRYRQKQAKRITRDPRFDDLSGTYNESLFKRSYAFLDDLKAKEKVKLQKKVHKERDEEKAAHMKYVINRITEQERSQKEKKQKMEHLKAVERKEKALVQEGKTPFYLKKSEKKKLELAEKFRDLKKSGKLDKYLNKKRKKIASKDRKHLPKMHSR